MLLENCHVLDLFTINIILSISVLDLELTIEVKCFLYYILSRFITSLEEEMKVHENELMEDLLCPPDSPFHPLKLTKLEHKLERLSNARKA